MSVSRTPRGRSALPNQLSGRSKRQSGRSLPHRINGLAFYDVDGTLVDLNLVHAALFIMANLGEWSGRLRYLLAFAMRLPRLYMAERNDRRLLNALLFEAFKGVSRDRLMILGEEYCERLLMRHLFPQARELVEANRAAGL